MDPSVILSLSLSSSRFLDQAPLKSPELLDRIQFENHLAGTNWQKDYSSVAEPASLNSRDDQSRARRDEDSEEEASASDASNVQPAALLPSNSSVADSTQLQLAPDENAGVDPWSEADHANQAAQTIVAIENDATARESTLFNQANAVPKDEQSVVPSNSKPTADANSEQAPKGVTIQANVSLDKPNAGVANSELEPISSPSISTDSAVTVADEAQTSIALTKTQVLDQAKGNLESDSGRKDRNQRWFERPTMKKLGPDNAVTNQDRVADMSANTLTARAASSADQSSPPTEFNQPGANLAIETATQTPASDVSSSISIISTAASQAASNESQALSIGSTSSTAVDSPATSNPTTFVDRLPPTQSARPASSHVAGGVTAHSPTDVSNLDRMRLIQRVARSFSRLGPEGGSVQLRLHPPELGAMAMRVKIEQGGLSAHMITESQAARAVILDSLPQLRSRLAEQGYEVAQILVEVGDSSSFDISTDTDKPASQDSNAQHHGTSSSQHPTDLRRANHLRRQLDLQIAKPLATVRTGIDVHA